MQIKLTMKVIGIGSSALVLIFCIFRQYNKHSSNFAYDILIFYLVSIKNSFDYRNLPYTYISTIISVITDFRKPSEYIILMKNYLLLCRNNQHLLRRSRNYRRFIFSFGICKMNLANLWNLYGCSKTFSWL